MPDGYLETNLKNTRRTIPDFNESYEHVCEELRSLSERLLELLVRKIHELVPEETSKLYTKLEKLGDSRISDIGR